MPSSSRFRVPLPELPHAALAVGVGDKPQPPAKILSVRLFENPARTILAYVDCESPSGIQYFGCKLMVGPKGARWLAMPSTMRRDTEGKPILGDEGKPIWDQPIGFRNKAIRERFAGMFLAALRRSHSELFTGVEE